MRLCPCLIYANVITPLLIKAAYTLDRQSVSCSKHLRSSYGPQCYPINETLPLLKLRAVTHRLLLIFTRLFLFDYLTYFHSQIIFCTTLRLSMAKKDNHDAILNSSPDPSTTERRGKENQLSRIVVHRVSSMDFTHSYNLALRTSGSYKVPKLKQHSSRIS